MCFALSEVSSLRNLDLGKSRTGLILLKKNIYAELEINI